MSMPSPRSIAQSIVWGNGLPGFDEVPDILAPDGLAQLVQDGPVDSERWAQATEAIDRLRLGILAAIAWKASKRFVEDPNSAFALGEVGQGVVEGRPFDQLDENSPLASCYLAEYAEALDGVTAAMAADEQGLRLLRIGWFMNVVANGYASRLRSAETLERVRRDPPADLSRRFVALLGVPARVNASTLLAPVRTARRELPGAVDGMELLEVVARSMPLVSQLTGLSIDAVGDLQVKMSMERSTDMPEDSSTATWHPDWVRLSDDDGPPRLVANGGDGDRIVDLNPLLRPSSKTVGGEHRRFLEREEKRNRVHVGCPVDLPLSPRPDAPAISGVRMIGLRLAHTLAALSSATDDDGIIRHVSASPLLPRSGAAAMDDVLLLDHGATVALARSPGRRAQLAARCPVTGRTTVARRRSATPSADRAALPRPSNPSPTADPGLAGHSSTVPPAAPTEGSLDGGGASPAAQPQRPRAARRSSTSFSGPLGP